MGGETVGGGRERDRLVNTDKRKGSRLFLLQLSISFPLKVQFKCLPSSLSVSRSSVQHACTQEAHSF